MLEYGQSLYSAYIYPFKNKPFTAPDAVFLGLFS